MKITKQLIVNASVQRLWEIMATQFADVSYWASNVDASRGRKNKPHLQGSSYSGRVCETSMGTFTETLLVYDVQAKKLAYDAKGDKMPFFVKGLQNHWTFTPLTADKCRVEMEMTISLLPVFNILMGGMMRTQMNSVINQTVEELSYFAENGVPHPNKLKAQKNLQMKGA